MFLSTKLTKSDVLVSLLGLMFENLDLSPFNSVLNYISTDTPKPTAKRMRSAVSPTTSPTDDGAAKRVRKPNTMLAGFAQDKVCAYLLSARRLNIFHA